MTITRRSLLTALAASPLAACVPVEPREVQLARLTGDRLAAFRQEWDALNVGPRPAVRWWAA